MFGMGLTELVIVGIIAVLLFGKRLPEVARSLGQSYHQFREGLREVQTEIDRTTREARRPLYEQTPSLPYHESDHRSEATPVSDESTSALHGARNTDRQGGEKPSVTSENQ